MGCLGVGFRVLKESLPIGTTASSTLFLSFIYIINLMQYGANYINLSVP